jgi:hypothetical protein
MYVTYNSYSSSNKNRSAFVNILTRDRQGKISLMVYEVKRRRKNYGNEGDDMKLELENLE